MPARPLILAPPTDPHACAVAWALRQRGVDPLWMASLQTTPGAHYTFRIGEEGMSFDDGHPESDRIGAVWNRRLEDPKPRCAPEDLGFAQWEWKLFQRNVFSLDGAYEDALWVNPLHASQQAENKLLQLSVCRRLGIPFPETVVTTDAREVDALRRRVGRIVFKSFLVHQWENGSSGAMYAVGVTLLDQDSDLPADAMAVCPGIYQQYIDKAADVRVTFIGDRMFAVGLRKRAGGAYVDWRGHGSDPELHAEALAIPGPVEAKLRAFMRELGLVFGCIDLVIDKDGGFWFLEVNQAGQFLFVEDLVPGLPVLTAMATLLATGRVDFSLSPDPETSMARFWRSEELGRLKETIERTPIARPLFTVE